MINTQGFFDGLFKNAKENSVLLMDTKGNILQVNQNFSGAFGYKPQSLTGKNFAVLFTEKDRLAKKPEREVKLALLKGSKSDNNYLVHKDGTPVWVMGESIAVTNVDGEKYLLKIIQNIHTQKKLEHFLIESNEFFNAIFDSVKDVGFLILNTELRVLRINKTFKKLFGLKTTAVEGSKFSELDNAFWRSQDIKRRLADLIVNRKAMKNELFQFTNPAGKPKSMHITSKLMENEEVEKTILLIITLT